MDDFSRQIEEIEALSNIYGVEWKVESANTRDYSIEIANSKIKIYLYFHLPEDYPSLSPPIYELSAPTLNKAQKDDIYRAINELYLENIGEPILYQWIEKVREISETLNLDIDKIDALHITQDVVKNTENYTIFGTVECPEIIHGEIIEDRKSYFQGHVATIKSKEDILLVIHTLKSIRKIADATHNIVAWKCGVHQDCDDDGEKAAGGRLLNLLEILNVDNIVVVVTRWYGGIHLGPVRFRHINNAARQVLIQAGIINN